MAKVQKSPLELSIVLPCLNEAETLAVCIDKAQGFLRAARIRGEVVVADNGSTDGSQAIARRHGARLVPVASRGYGAALMGGIEAAAGRYVIMADADDSYDLEHLMPFVESLRQGHELVMGNRFRGGIRPGAMPPLHRYLGNPVLTGLGRLFFSSPLGDFHCGLRGFDKAAILGLNLQTTGMEFASEMIVKTTLARLRVAEVPTTLSPDGRSRPPHLKSWRDGWRHLRFLLIYSPRWLFLYPGLLLMLLGAGGLLALLPGPIRLGRVEFDIHTMLYATVGMIVGLQVVAFYLFSRVYAVQAKLLPADERIRRLTQVLSLETGLVVGGLLGVVGLAGSLYAMVVWGQQSFGPLSAAHMMRLVTPSLACLALGVQIAFMSFFLSLLNLQHR